MIPTSAIRGEHGGESAERSDAGLAVVRCSPWIARRPRGEEAERSDRRRRPTTAVRGGSTVASTASSRRRRTARGRPDARPRSRRSRSGARPDRPASSTRSTRRAPAALDEAFGFDSGDTSDKPEAPEIGEPVFFDVVRPLGEKKYANEFNYLLNPSTRNAPTLQILEYEYVFADWNAVELDLSYFNRKLEILTPFYQRTLGVGRDGNWVHGVQVSADIYVRSKFLGGSAVYVLGWKPRRSRSSARSSSPGPTGCSSAGSPRRA